QHVWLRVGHRHCPTGNFKARQTDDRVWVDETGRETVAANRGDSQGLSHLRRAGIDLLVISREVNAVVTARCNKLKIPALQGVLEKGGALRQALAERGTDPAHVIYVGNDVIDLPCFEIAGWAVAVADAQPDVLRAADYVLSRKGGFGAVRELCDLILKRMT
ncbi:MAG TPA: HAD hydrolase family protein, partial [Anaerolineaceae bacterium]|nr:HAD hydrolase family protein [Anaerolineaceae bacterium]